MLFFIKNNPQKLLSKYSNSEDQNIPEKKKIIKRLIELDAEDELLTLFVRGNKTSKNINNYLFEKYQDDQKQLLWFYNQNIKKNECIERLIDLDAEEELLQIFDKDKMNDNINDYLFEKYKNDPKQLLVLHDNDVKRNGCIERLINLDAEEEILQIFNKDKMNEKINNYFLQKYQNDPKQLFWLYNQNIKKNECIKRLIYLDAEKQILQIFNKDKIDDNINDYLFEKYKKDPKQLLWLYNQNIKKNECIERLINLDAEEQIVKIFSSNTKKDKINNYLLKKYQNSPQKLLWLVDWDIKKDECIKLLIYLDAEVQILKIFNKTRMNERINNYFFKKHQNNHQKLLWLANHNIKKNECIERLINLDAKEQILEIFSKTRMNEKINNYFLKKYKTNPKQLLWLFNYNIKQVEIIRNLIRLNAQKELYEIITNDTFNKEICNFIFKQNTANNEELFRLYEKCNLIDFKYKILDQLNRNKAVTELNKIISFRNIFNISELNFIYKYHYDYEQIIDINKITLENINKQIDKSLILEVSLSFMEYLIKFPEPEYLQSYIINNYAIFFKAAFQELSHKLLSILCFISADKFHEQSMIIINKYEFVGCLEDEKIKIKNNYAELIIQTDTKEGMKKLVFDRNLKLAQLFPTESKNILTDIENQFVIKREKKQVVITNLITIEKIFQNPVIVQNVDVELNSINNEMKNQLMHISDINEIMKIKTKMKQKQNNIVDKNIFCNSLQFLNEKESNTNKVIHILGELLIKSEFMDVKESILKFSISSNNRLWLKYIYKIKHYKELQYLILASIKNKTSCWNLLFLKDMINNKDIPLLKTITNHSSYIDSVAFSPNCEILAFGSRDNTIRLWDMSSGKKLKTLIGHSDCINSLVFSPDGKILASGSWDKTIKLWDVSSGKELKTLTGHLYRVDSVAFSPNGEILASGSHASSIRLWDVSSGKELKTLTGHSYRVDSVAFSPNGKILASGSYDYTIKLWNVESGRELKTLTGHSRNVLSVAFSPNGEILASGSQDRTIRLWDVGSGRELKKLTGHSDFISSVVYSPNGKILASGSHDKSIRLWDISSGKELKTLIGHFDDVRSVAFSLNGEILASGSADGTVKLWNIEAFTMRSKLYLIEHLLHFLLNPDERNIPDLTKFLHEIPKLPQDMRQPVKEIVEEIISKAGRQSKSIEIAEENNPTSKDLEIVY